MISFQRSVRRRDEAFNGISSTPDGRFRVAVGNLGTIVHFTEAHPNGVVVASGTSEDLFDVYVVSADFAVASGRDAVLMWDGTEWTIIVDRPGLYLPVWATPEEDVVFYNQVDESGGFTPFHLRCGWDVETATDLFGCYAGPLDLTYCGQSDGLVVLNENGDFEAINRDMAPVNGTSSVIHDDTTGLSLTAAFIPPGSCLQGGVVPTSAFAINNFRQVWEWSGETWLNTGVNVPADQTLTWISGTGPDHVLAVGSKPSDDINDPGNDAIVLQYDGIVWGPVVTDLGDDLPGMTDLVLISNFENRVFHSSMEQTQTVCFGPDQGSCTPPPPPVDCVVTGNGFCDILISSGEDGQVVKNDSIAPPTNVDIYLQASILNYGDLSEDEQKPINYGVLVGNNGPDTAEGVGLLIIESTESLIVLDCPDFSLERTGHFYQFRLNSSLPAGESRRCEVTVTSEPSISTPVTWGGSILVNAYSKPSVNNSASPALTTLILTTAR